MRIVSLLPSTTEIICELGLEKQLVGRSHECRQSEYVRSLPVITTPELKTEKNSGDIHSGVQYLVENGLSVFKTDGDLLGKLKPDLVLTQDHCEVCAASLDDVEQAVHTYCSPDTTVLSVSPETIDEIFESILAIGEAANVTDIAGKLVEELVMRFGIIRQTVNGTPRNNVVTLEWLDPLMTGGNWIPELVEFAGGEPTLAEAGIHSPAVKWHKIMDQNPDKLLITPCGYPIHQTKKEMHLLTSRDGWQELKAVKNDEIYILDGDRFFNRPGPGIYDSARIVAEINHPGLFKPLYENDGWVRWSHA
jgi:iron complex transport system substrate-binding protein